ncbi:MAG: terminase [Magnetococcales bacterium]|nr:terminase [Magnetococcales bacterium]
MLADDLRFALDPVAFARERLAITPDPWQERALRLRNKRLLLNCSRQAGKSTLAAIAVLHQAIFFAGSLSILISPSQRQSSELFRKVTQFLGRLQQKPEMTEENKLSLILKGGSRVVSLPASEATIRGFSGANLIVEDEASRVPDDLYRSIRPMLATSDGRLILMSTPFGRRGHFFEEWQRPERWERISIKGSECPRIRPEFLEEERASLGDWWFSQEYGCEFVENTDQVFSYDAVMAAMSSEIKPLFA